MTQTSELLRQLRVAQDRDPVENAVMALAALSPEQRRQAAARFNDIFGKCVPPCTIEVR